MVAAGKAASKKRLKRCDPKRMWALRMKFVEQCQKYIGTPYKKKYHEPGTAAYNSPLFLDCCGLVRRAVRDLQSDFGFELGPWNQTYMYDTLPTILTRESQMKPGDLVFISGIYYNEKMKQQLHGIVHVEIWLGDGRKTIGARWHKGRVQIFDSYRFKSQSYHSMRYHFKSINTWLMGICKSHCPIHAWRLSTDFKPTKKSVLHVTTPEQQQSATDEDQSKSSVSKQAHKAEQSETTEDNDSGVNGNNDVIMRSNVSSASCGSSEDSQEQLMKNILLSGSDIVDFLSDKLHISSEKGGRRSPVHGHNKSLTFIQVSRSIERSPTPLTGNYDRAPPSGYI